MHAPVRQITTAPHGHLLTNVGVWSPDSRRIVYDVRSDAAGDVFDGDRIETVDVETGEVTVLYEATDGAKCGVATYSPVENRVVFILGPDHPTPDFSYGPARRRGVVVDEARPGVYFPLDARDLEAPFTPGALRGGSHVHVFSPDGRFVSFTYEDHVLSEFSVEADGREVNLRHVGVSLLGQPVRVVSRHSRNHDGISFSVLVTRTTAHPRPGSDDIQKAFEEAWIGTHGYQKSDGSWQKRALAFQGLVVTESGATIAELFVVDVPDDMSVPSDGPLEGTATTRPRPPLGTVQRRLTFTANRTYPGLQGPRHWPRSSPDGTQLAFLMQDDAGIVQLWTNSPNGGTPIQLTCHARAVESSFTWSPDGDRIAHVMDGRICVTDVATGTTVKLTENVEGATSPRPEACVFSPDGQRIAHVRRVRAAAGTAYNQIFVCEISD